MILLLCLNEKELIKENSSVFQKAKLKLKYELATKICEETAVIANNGLEKEKVVIKGIETIGDIVEVEEDIRIVETVEGFNETELNVLEVVVLPFTF